MLLFVLFAWVEFVADFLRFFRENHMVDAFSSTLAFSESADFFSFVIHPVLVDDPISSMNEESPFFDDLDFSFLPDNEMEPAAEGTASSSTSSSVSTSDDSSSSEQKKGGKKRDRVLLDLVPGQIVLPKAVELEVPSLEEYEEYMRRVGASRVLTEAQKTDLQNQRKRIRNRLYSQQKRQKEKVRRVEREFSFGRGKD